MGKPPNFWLSGHEDCTAILFPYYMKSSTFLLDDRDKAKTKLILGGSWRFKSTVVWGNFGHPGNFGYLLLFRIKTIIALPKHIVNQIFCYARWLLSLPRHFKSIAIFLSELVPRIKRWNDYQFSNFRTIIKQFIQLRSQSFERNYFV